MDHLATRGEHIDPNDFCIETEGIALRHGRPVVNRNYKVRNLAAIVAGTPQEPGIETDHLCRNIACIRWDHLEIVTRRENTRRGRLGLIEDNPKCRKCGAEDWHRYTNSKGFRVRRCRPCENAYKRSRRAKNKLSGGR